MNDRYRYISSDQPIDSELEAWSEYTINGALSLRELADLPVYHEATALKDTYYDGHIVRLELLLGTLCPRDQIILDLVGPFWDRIFRITFFGVSDFVTGQTLISNLFYIRNIELSTSDDGRHRFKLTTIAEDRFLEIEYQSDTVSRLILDKPVRRKKTDLQRLIGEG